MKQSRYYLSIILIITSLLSCDFSETNLDEESISEVTASDLLNPAISQIAFNQSGNTGRISAILMQYFVQGYSSNGFGSYNIPHLSTNNYWINALYTGSLKNAKDLYNLSEKENNSDLKGIALILQVNEFLHATTMFGDIPLSNALEAGDHEFPTFDTQETVYQELLEMTEEAIDLLGNNGINGSLVEIDFVFKGDMARWKQFAFGLKSRLHLHLTSKDPSNYNQVLESVENSFSSINEQANFTWTHNNQIANPLFTFNIQRPSTYTISETFANGLIDRNDPRMELTTRFDSTRNYWAYQQFLPYNFHWSVRNTTLPLFSFVELQFMKAEALLMTGASDIDVSSALKEGIKASCQQMELDPSTYIEYADTQSSFIGLNTQEDKLEHIITEAYFSYYGYAFHQSWNNYKRLGIPNLEPTGSSNEFNPSGTLPVRFVYPQIELDLNAVNTNEAIDRQNGALLDEPLWIFK